MRYTAAGKSDVGQKRDNNEDSYLVDPVLGLYMVCDGMGGHQAGEVASAAAIEAVARTLEEHHKNFADLAKTKEGQAELLAAVEKAVDDAGKTIFERAKANSAQKGMGTTLTLLLTLGNKAIVAHVGDSRLYLIRSGEVHQLSTDHTFVNALVASGTLSPEEAKTHPYSSVLTRCLGIQETVMVDTLMFDVVSGDTFVLCSDGFSGCLETPDELLMMLDGNVTELPTTLVDLANVRGGSDNITAVVVRALRAPADTLLETDVPLSSESQNHVAQLSHLFLCRGLRMQEILRVLNTAELVNVEAGQTLIRENDKLRGLVVVLEGRLRAVHADEALDLVPGHSFGAGALAAESIAEDQVVAGEAAKVLVLDRERFQRLAQRRPTLGVRLLFNLAAHLAPSKSSG